MKVTLTKFESESTKGPLREGERYQDFDHELDSAGSIQLLESLEAANSRLLIKGPYCNLEFEVVPGSPVAVEIYDSRKGFWAIAEVSPLSARRIIMMAEAGEQFGNLIPETTLQWGAYGLGSSGMD